MTCQFAPTALNHCRIRTDTKPLLLGFYPPPSTNMGFPHKSLFNYCRREKLIHDFSGGVSLRNVIMLECMAFDPVMTLD